MVRYYIYKYKQGYSTVAINQQTGNPTKSCIYPNHSIHFSFRTKYGRDHMPMICTRRYAQEARTMSCPCVGDPMPMIRAPSYAQDPCTIYIHDFCSWSWSISNAMSRSVPDPMLIIFARSYALNLCPMICTRCYAPDLCSILCLESETLYAKDPPLWSFWSNLTPFIRCLFESSWDGTNHISCSGILFYKIKWIFLICTFIQM